MKPFTSWTAYQKFDSVNDGHVVAPTHLDGRRIIVDNDATMPITVAFSDYADKSHHFIKSMEIAPKQRVDLIAPEHRTKQNIYMFVMCNGRLVREPAKLRSSSNYMVIREPGYTNAPWIIQYFRQFIP